MRGAGVSPCGYNRPKIEAVLHTHDAQLPVDRVLIQQNWERYYLHLGPSIKIGNTGTTVEPFPVNSPLFDAVG